MRARRDRCVAASPIALALSLAACGADPLIGSWTMKGNPDIDLQVREGTDYSDFLGDGHLYWCPQSQDPLGPDGAFTVDPKARGVCSRCPINYQIEDDDDGDFTFQGTVEGCTSVRVGAFFCSLADGDSSLECRAQGGSFRYRRTGD